MKKSSVLFVLMAASGICFSSVYAQKRLVLDLNQTIALANDSSLESFRTQNMYLSGYWEYRTYRANRLPSLTMDLTPAQYNRDITKRYDSGQDLDVYRTQQSYYAYGGLSVRQNLDLTGGTFYLESNLAYMRNFGDNSATQFTSVPIRLGYSQSLVGYNPFKWDRKIEPLKYERVKKEFLYNVEKVSETATNYFFSLAMAQAEYKLAKENLASTDTLYRIGQQRHRIAAISQADLLTLKLDKVNAQNTLQNRASALKRAMFSLASFLNLDKNTQIELELPSRPSMMEIPVDEALRWGRSNNPQLLELKQNVLEAERNVDRTKKESRFKYNMARNNLNVVKISARQDEISIEEEVIMTVSDFNIQQQLIASAEEALDLAILAYNETRQRFIIGKADINSLTLSLNRQQEAQRNYISALQNYWLNYYKIRRLTLFDFATKLSLSDRFDFNGGRLIR